MERVRAQLQFIARIKRDEKVCVGVQSLSKQKTGRLNSLYRMLTSNSREETYRLIESVFNAALAYLESKDIEDDTYEHLRADIMGAFPGIQNTLKTYEHDDMFYCKLNVLQQDVCKRLRRIDTAKGKRPSERIADQSGTV